MQAGENNERKREGEYSCFVVVSKYDVNICVVCLLMERNIQKCFWNWHQTRDC